MDCFIQTHDNAEEGKRILILAGVHGDESAPLYLLSQINSTIDDIMNDQIKSITIVNGYNEPAIDAGERGVMFDLNRALSEFDVLLDALKQLIEENDIIIDLHSSANCSAFVLVDNDENAEKMINWCTTAKVNFLVRNSSNPTIKKYAFSRNKMGITIEMAGLNLINFTSAKNAYGIIKRMLSNLNFKEEKVEIKTAKSILSKSNGLFIPKISLGATVSEDTEIADIIGYDGSVLETIVADGTGKYLVGPEWSIVQANNEIIMIQP